MATKQCKITTKVTRYGTTEILYKHGREILCYISCGENKYVVCNGKPSDRCCLGWTYDNLDDAKKDAQEMFDSYLALISGLSDMLKSHRKSANIF